MMRRVVVGVALVAVSMAGAGNAQAQAAPAVSAAMDRAISRARALVDNGSGSDARNVLDSLVGAAANANDLGEALFWRAALAERVGDAERDWKRLIIEVPLSPRGSDALVRLGELEMLRGHPVEARTYFSRVVREYPGGAGTARSQLWIAKSYVAQRDLPRACVTLVDAAATGVPEGELRLQAEELGRQCATVDKALIAKASDELKGRVSTAATTPATAAPAKVAAADVPSKPTAPVAGKGKFSVQLAAYDTRAEADASVKRMVSRGIDARVDGEEKPFRVRAGYYETRAAASAALAKLKKQGQTGFVAEIAK
ncbi:SPOR domain-containing protein [Gemmatimonas sp.]|uniref:SPOR domain-containing protein n=1 Tax=Gemmatimonas sp. TaxID=1962908 RepID=UPI0033414CC7